MPMVFASAFSKDRGGDQKIIADDNLKEVLFANTKSLEKMFGGK